MRFPQLRARACNAGLLLGALAKASMMASSPAFELDDLSAAMSSVLDGCSHPPEMVSAFCHCWGWPVRQNLTASPPSSPCFLACGRISCSLGSGVSGDQPWLREIAHWRVWTCPEEDEDMAHVIAGGPAACTRTSHEGIKASRPRERELHESQEIAHFASVRLPRSLCNHPVAHDLWTGNKLEFKPISTCWSVSAPSPSRPHWLWLAGWIITSDTKAFSSVPATSRPSGRLCQSTSRSATM